MEVQRILSEIDAEIRKLVAARTVLSTIESGAGVGTRRPGRPKVYQQTQPKRRGMSPEGRARIAASMKRRWAEKRAAAKTSSRRSPSRKAPAKAVVAGH